MNQSKVYMMRDLWDATTLHEFDAICLTPVEDLSPREIKSIRLREKVSQGVFALYLHTSLSTVQQWERGDKHPRGPALKMLNIIAQKRFKSGCLICDGLFHLSWI